MQSHNNCVANDVDRTCHCHSCTVALQTPSASFNIADLDHYYHQRPPRMNLLTQYSGFLNEYASSSEKLCIMQACLWQFDPNRFRISHTLIFSANPNWHIRRRCYWILTSNQLFALDGSDITFELILSSRLDVSRWKCSRWLDLNYHAVFNELCLTHCTFLACLQNFK